MSKKAEVNRIELVVGGKKISLTVKEAKDLRDILVDLMGGDSKAVIHVERWRYPWVTPWYWGGWAVTCGGTGTDSGNLTSSNTTDTITLTAGSTGDTATSTVYNS